MVTSRAILGNTYAVSGKEEEARNILGSLKDLLDKNPFVLLYTAGLYAALHQFDGAFELLNALCDNRFGPLYCIKATPWFDPLRSDRRFGELLRRMGLPE